MHSPHKGCHLNLQIPALMDSPHLLMHSPHKGRHLNLQNAAHYCVTAMENPSFRVQSRWALE
ncbi:hypothetical protein HanXRQr2_Chr16g0761031 [Helianthus annuus]|uniref:Uncharacterized protein n=1 Tax=Helianthus annuus TaxID=4232 RepID=A0A9K3GZ37_HELAN|nr:hypothetical protein HanXRQr2_Chr16g0761031 [Helianthus annuus]KAJ0822203.1 hypothetical protein HanPSC8_Chr16g0729231 [Helianthus annuus]